LRRAVDLAKTGLLAIQDFAERVAIGGELWFDLDASVSEYGKVGGVSESAFLVFEELLSLVTHIGDQLIGRVDGINEDDDFDRLLFCGDDLEACYGPLGFVVEDGEVLLAKGCDWLAGFGVDYDIEFDLLRLWRGRDGGRSLLGGSRK
jgi:hypothetical protein